MEKSGCPVRFQTSDSRMLKIEALTREDVGRSSTRSSAFSFRPRHCPPEMEIIGLESNTDCAGVLGCFTRLANSGWNPEFSSVRHAAQQEFFRAVYLDRPLTILETELKVHNPVHFER